MLQNACEIIKKKLYFLATDSPFYPPPDVVVVNVDFDYIYKGYYGDFGPLNISCIYKYCQNMNKKFKLYQNTSRKIIHVTSLNSRRKVNSAFLMGCFLIAYIKMTPQETFKALSQNNYRYISFRDAAIGRSTFYLSLINCLRGFDRAICSKILKLRLFNISEYDHYDNIQNGDINWIIPKKLMAFTGPCYKTQLYQGYLYHTPEMYVSAFHKWRVSAVIRLNPPEYDESSFTKVGIDHFDLIFPDGGVPSEKLVRKFLKILDNATGAVAVHCKAGLGRTGTLIGCYLMKQYKFTAGESIAWIRICRPGSVIGYQQNWLMDHQTWCWKIGSSIPRMTRHLNKSSEKKSSIPEIKLDKPFIMGDRNELLSIEKDSSIIPSGDILNSLKSFNLLDQNSLERKDSDFISNILWDDSNFPKFGRNKIYDKQNKRSSSIQLKNSLMKDNSLEEFTNVLETSTGYVKKSNIYQLQSGELNNSTIIPDFDIRQYTSRFLTSKSHEH